MNATRPAPTAIAVALLGAAALAGSLVTGCAGPSGGRPVTLEMWALGREGEVVRDLLPEFERRNPGISVRVQQIPWTAAHEKLLTSFVGRSTPDVAQVGNTWIPEFAALGAIEPLDARIARSTILSPGDYFAGIWDSNVVDGVVLGIPWYVDTRLLFYRSDLLEAAGWKTPPRDWGEWRDAMLAIKKRAGPERYAIFFPLNEWQPQAILGLEAGSTLLRDGGRYGAFRGPEFRRAMEFYVGAFRDGLAPPATNTQIANLYQQFAAGYFAMYITGPWNLGEFRRRLPPEEQDRWATAPLPAAEPGGTAPGVSLAGGASLVIFEASPRKDEAWKLVEYLSEPAQQVRFYAMMGDLPARTAAWSDPSLAGDPKARAFFEQLHHVRSLPKVPEWEQIATRIFERLEAAARGKASLDEVLAGLDSDVDRMLQKRRWLLDRRSGGAR